MTVLSTVRVGRDSRVTIPKEVREVLDLEESDELLFFITEGWKDAFASGKNYVRE